jgi:hypothetical protein
MLSVYFENIKEELLCELDKAKESILIAVCWFTDRELYDKLSEKLSCGIKISLIIHNDYINNRKTGLPFQNLIDKGCNFYFSEGINQMMHNKFCIIDKDVLISGSFNWTYHAEYNFENILIVKNQPEIISAFSEEFKRFAKLFDKIKNIKYNEINDKEKSFDFNYNNFIKKDIEKRDKINSKCNFKPDHQLIENNKIKPMVFIESALLKIIKVDDYIFNFKNNPNVDYATFTVTDKSYQDFKLFIKHDQLAKYKLYHFLLEDLVGCSVELVNAGEDRILKANFKPEDKKFIYFEYNDKFHFSEEYKTKKIEDAFKINKLYEKEKEKELINEKLKKEIDELKNRSAGL